MGTEWIEHKGKRILYVDYRGLKGAQLIEMAETEAKTIVAAPTKVLVLDDFEGISVDSEFMNRIKQLGKDAEPKTARCAILGVTGLKEILLRAYNAFTGGRSQPFRTKAEALDWLAQGD